ncbi:MAG: Eco57I restriction-modification methylase domain-containing protein [Opitutales bacterium]|nr:Eco57I restriction-modification methylase domain-containing protein [Opitutales bacterium]
MTEAWLHHADFLTRPYSTGFTHIVGNPPYLRIESLPRPLMQRYRALFRTMYDRADLYIAFFEKGLSLLEPEGKLGYICANRWIKNRYGGPLREMIASAFHLETYVDFTGVDAFHGEVIAYPAVTVIRNGSGRTTRVVEKEDVHCDTLPDLSERLLKHQADPRIKEMDGIADKGAPWLFSNAKRLLVIQHLERSLPTLEEAGCKVGIGVATGADKVYIGTDAELDVEPGRKLPLLTRADLKNNRIEWTGKYVLNPFDGDHPGLVDPDDFPKFKAYLATHRDAIQGRHVAKKNPRAWFKTIDRIYPTLSATPKLVIPDIQGDPQVAYDAGAFYPHHNLYYITSNEWDLRALQTVLRSRLANAFVATYSLRMRGDCLRFQAQYLRRIRLPRWSTLSPDLQTTLKSLAESNDLAKIEIIVRSLYGLDETDWEALCADSPNGRATSVPEPIPLLATASSSKMKKNPDVCPNAATPPSISPPTPYSKLPLTRNACASSANAWFRNAFTPPPPSSPRHPMPPNPVSSVTCPPRLPSAG